MAFYTDFTRYRSPLQETKSLHLKLPVPRHTLRESLTHGVILSHNIVVVLKRRVRLCDRLCKHTNSRMSPIEESNAVT